MSEHFLEEITSEESFTALVSPWRRAAFVKKDDSDSDEAPTASREEYMGVSVFKIIVATLTEFRKKDPRKFHYTEQEKCKIAALCLIIRGVVERYLLLQENMFLQRSPMQERDIERLLERHYGSLVKKGLSGRTFEMKIQLVGESHFVEVWKDDVMMELRELVRLEDVLWARSMQCINVALHLIVMMMHMAGVELESIPLDVLEKIIEDLMATLQRDRFPKMMLCVETLAKSSEEGCCNLELGTCIYLLLFEIHYNGTIFNVIATRNILKNQWLSLGTALKVLGTMLSASSTGGYALAAEIELALREPNDLKQKLAQFMNIKSILIEKSKAYCGIEINEDMFKRGAMAKYDSLTRSKRAPMDEAPMDEGMPKSQVSVMSEEVTADIEPAKEELAVTSEEMVTATPKSGQSVTSQVSVMSQEVTVDIEPVKEEVTVTSEEMVTATPKSGQSVTSQVSVMSEEVTVDIEPAQEEVVAMSEEMIMVKSEEMVTIEEITVKIKQLTTKSEQEDDY